MTMPTSASEYPLSRLAELVGGRIEGDSETPIRALNGVELAEPGEITFIIDAKQRPEAEISRASACITPPDGVLSHKPCLVAEEPAVAAARIHAFLLERPFEPTGVHPTAVIGANCAIPEAVSIGPHVVIGDNVLLGERVRLHPGVVLEDNVAIGDDAILHAHVFVGAGCVIGRRCILHPGAVIGADGFGFATDRRGRHYKKPQVGVVRIEDEVEIGANTCIDRAAFGVTHIKAGVKIDNLVMIGHNVVVGEGSVLVAQAGVAGSATLGRHVVLGGQVGVAGHLALGDGVMAAAKSGIHTDLKNGEVVGGSPAIAAKDWMKAAGIYNRLPEMRKELRRLGRELAELRAALQAQGT